MGDGVTLPRAPTAGARRSGAAGAITLVRRLAAAAALAVPLALVLRRVEVAGDSMLPALAPGDRLLVLRRPGGRRRVGQVVALRDPRRPGEARLLVKRVVGVTPRGVEVRGDNPAASTDSRTFGPVPPALVVGAVIYRYAPLGRAGRLNGGRGGEETAGTLGS
jgi:nickel-type superoxide dismutase maturation protease